jgi:hypothetical protein
MACINPTHEKQIVNEGGARRKLSFKSFRKSTEPHLSRAMSYTETVARNATELPRSSSYARFESYCAQNRTKTLQRFNTVPKRTNSLRYGSLGRKFDQHEPINVQWAPITISAPRNRTLSVANAVLDDLPEQISQQHKPKNNSKPVLFEIGTTPANHMPVGNKDSPCPFKTSIETIFYDPVAAASKNFKSKSSVTSRLVQLVTRVMLTLHEQ